MVFNRCFEWFWLIVRVYVSPCRDVIDGGILKHEQSY